MLNLFKEDIWKRKKELDRVIPTFGFSVSPDDYSAQCVLMSFLDKAESENIVLSPEMKLFIHRTLGLSVVRNYSNFGSLERLVLDVAGSPPVYDVNPTTMDDIIGSWFRKVEVPVIVVSGFMGSGKTDFSLSIGEVAVNLGYKIVTNIKTEYCSMVKNYEELIRFLKDTDGSKLFIYDEAGVSMDSRRSGSSLNVALSHFVILARKFGAGLVVILQEESFVDIRIRKLCNVVVQRINKKRCVVFELFDKEVRYDLVNIDETHVVYDTYDVASFSLEESSDSKKYDPFKVLGGNNDKG